MTGDSDIRRILFNTLSYLSYSNRTEYREILDSVRKNETSIYFVEKPQIAKLDFNISQFNPEKKRKGITPDNLQTIESEITPFNPLHIQ